MLKDASELYHILSSRRKRDGSLDFDLPESRIILNEDGEPIDVILSDRRVANRLIEEFMLAANRTVAEHYSGRKNHLSIEFMRSPILLK